MSELQALCSCVWIMVNLRMIWKSFVDNTKLHLQPTLNKREIDQLNCNLVAIKKSFEVQPNKIIRV